MQKILDKLTSDWQQGKIHSFLNPFSYYKLRNRMGLLQEIDLLAFDGQLLVLLFRGLGLKHLTRKSFDMTSLAKEVLSKAVENEERVFIVGTTPELIERAVTVLSDAFEGLNVTGYHHGYLGDQHDQRNQLITRIIDLRVDTVIVGMGAPLQEEFLVALKQANWHGTGFTCGGFLHQSARDIDYYPHWINRYHLRWLYRIYDEPRLFQRYFLLYPWAIMLIIYDFKLRPMFVSTSDSCSLQE
jgi:exopolysaccharide biosynthesis WecB/TagA/CpsF family protein